MIFINDKIDVQAVDTKPTHTPSASQKLMQPTQNRVRAKKADELQNAVLMPSTAGISHQAVKKFELPAAPITAKVLGQIS